MMKSTNRINRESGAVSLFVVIFAALLMTVVTVSFIRIMISDQNQAIDTDLSQSAYDSALAGVEDGKRALLRYAEICRTQPEAVCNDLAQQLTTDVCNQAVRVGDVVPASSENRDGITDANQFGEIRIQQQLSSDVDLVLDQAYTCLTMDLQTPDYLATLSTNQSKVVPLFAADRGTGAPTQFDTVTIEWFSRDDISSGASEAIVNLPNVTQAASKPLRAQADWPAERPPVLRVNVMQFGTDFSLNDFDASAGAQSNTNSVFLYPSSAAGALNSRDASGNFVTSFALGDRDVRRDSVGGTTPANAPLAVRCLPRVSSGGYACAAQFTLPEPIRGGDRTAFMRVTPFYNATSFRVSLASGPTRVDFDGVQPEIDSTGRANDLFRRVASRIDLIDTNFPFPDAALDVNGNVCKNFAVTPDEYIAGSPACTP